MNIETLKLNAHLSLLLKNLGGAVLTFYVFKFLFSFYKFFIRPAKNLRKFGEWAIITGATDGIGKAFSFEMAKKGLNVLLISRSEEKLKNVMSEILQKYPKVIVDYVKVDFENFDTVSEEKIRSMVSTKDIGILINNVGISYPYPKYFDELTEKEMQSLIVLNVKSTVSMTRLILPGMLNRKRGSIINMASGAAATPTALLSGYSAAKGFVLKLSESLNVELRPKNIHVQCQVPLLVATKVRKTTWDRPSPAAYAKAAVRFIGYESICSPYWSHALELFLMNILPASISNNINYKMHLNLRKKAMAKDNKTS